MFKTAFLLLLFVFWGRIDAKSQSSLEAVKKSEQAGNYTKAKTQIDLYFSSQTINKTAPDALLTRFRIYQRLGIEAFQNQKAYQSYFLEAASSLSKISLIEVSGTLRSFVQQEFNQSYLQWIQAGTESYNNQEFNDALFWFSLAKKIKPHEEELNELLIFTFFDLNMPDSVMKTIPEFIEMGFYNPQVLQIGLETAAGLHQFNKAQSWADLLTEKSENEEEFRKVITKFDTEAVQFYLSSKQEKSAIYHLHRLIEYTNDEWFKISLSRIYLITGQTEQAVFYLNQIFLPEINDPSVLDYYASVWLSVREINSEKLLSIQYWQLNKNSEWMRPYFLAKQAFSKMDFLEASKENQHSIDLNPTYVPSLYLQGQAFYQLALQQESDSLAGKWILKSLPFFEKAHQLKEDHPKLKETLHLIYKSIGDEENAERFQ